jgi:hypothetical protein
MQLSLGITIYLNEQVWCVTPKELNEVLVLQEGALLNDLKVRFWSFQEVHLLKEEISDLCHCLSRQNIGGYNSGQ